MKKGFKGPIQEIVSVESHQVSKRIRKYDEI